ncbi:MAG: bifunctional DNA-formamidopyrimidine glycosylase/DNA-(apurinic or apyrimidinic site) lyase [Candidatus Levybacteria bacterium]|nr:bifunctional DNA-formamidopyrimidine glycosylase/DNA-(apurinic or apyrimidinic site) lyase [Candidatus Levybacteria bacterium]MBP9814704.1 bifunctional DNA-formamidopyrimidine glycosylase/DNA-(apurinic or apyrimidinic site) lyase [Candidatus Levybacteria bacterium]
MPELPEVETIRRGLEDYLVGHAVEKVEILHPGVLFGDVNVILGQKVINVRRVGKGLIIDFLNNYSLAIHVKLTGQLIYRGIKTHNMPISRHKVGTVPNKFTHVIFDLDKDAKLYYNDQRRFGWIKILKTEDIMSLSFFKNMGPEPFKDLTIKVFEKILQNKTTKIKPLLMDQTKIGGIGNIYANDALFKAKINPERQAKSLSARNAAKLYRAIISVMEKSLKEGGASELSFVNALGQEGNYQEHTLVYGKVGKKCPVCEAYIKRITLAGRGTFFCEKCQK